MKSTGTKIALIVLAIVAVAICIRYLKPDSSTAKIAAPLKPVAPELVPIEIKLPKPMFWTGPCPLHVPNLEKPRCPDHW
jgi:hypothetical protein